jgi:HlyD family secretion protein
VDINRVKVGQPAMLTFDAISGKEYNGKVTDVSSFGAPSNGVVNFSVTVELTDADAQVRPGMTAAVNMTVEQLTNVLLVPNRAVRLQNGKQVVYILENGQPKAVEITLGASADTNTQILSGQVKAGDLVVLNPPTTLTAPGSGGGPGVIIGGK